MKQIIPKIVLLIGLLVAMMCTARWAEAEIVDTATGRYVNIQGDCWGIDGFVLHSQTEKHCHTLDGVVIPQVVAVRCYPDDPWVWRVTDITGSWCHGIKVEFISMRYITTGLVTNGVNSGYWEVVATTKIKDTLICITTWSEDTLLEAMHEVWEIVREAQEALDLN